MNEIVPKFSDSLVIETSNLVSDYLELGIDSLLENDNLKQIPIISTLIGVGKLTKNIRERNLMKNLVVFLNELNSGKIDKDALKKHQDNLRHNPKKAEK